MLIFTQGKKERKEPTCLSIIIIILVIVYKHTALAEKSYFR